MCARSRRAIHAWARLRGIHLSSSFHITSLVVLYILKVFVFLCQLWYNGALLARLDSYKAHEQEHYAFGRSCRFTSRPRLMCGVAHWLNWTFLRRRKRSKDAES